MLRSAEPFLLTRFHSQFSRGPCNIFPKIQVMYVLHPILCLWLEHPTRFGRRTTAQTALPPFVQPAQDLP